MNRQGDIDDELVVEVSFGGTAIAGVDIAYPTATATFAPGETVALVKVLSVPDDVVEGAESLVARAEARVDKGVLIARPNATVRIEDLVHQEEEPTTSDQPNWTGEQGDQGIPQPWENIPDVFNPEEDGSPAALPPDWEFPPGQIPEGQPGIVQTEGGIVLVYPDPDNPGGEIIITIPPGSNIVVLNGPGGAWFILGIRPPADGPGVGIEVVPPPVVA